MSVRALSTTTPQAKSRSLLLRAAFTLATWTRTSVPQYVHALVSTTEGPVGAEDFLARANLEGNAL
jgi:hypothetical protein